MMCLISFLLQMETLLDLNFKNKNSRKWICYIYLKLKTKISLNIDLEIYGLTKYIVYYFSKVVLWFPLVFFLLDTASKLDLAGVKKLNLLNFCP